MRKWWEEYQSFWKNKLYVLALSLTAVLGYGFFVTHQTIGIDDTPYEAYFQDGLSAIVGRWVTYLLNKIVHMADFSPFVTDLAGILILMLAVTVWCVLWKRIFGEKIPLFGYVLFSCLFLSNPLLSEVYPYYLHNGISIGYLCSGIALCAFWEGLQGCQRGQWKQRIAAWAVSAAALWIALGCYESFMIVYLVGVCILLTSVQMVKLQPKVGIFRALCIAAVIAGVAVVLRSVMVSGVTAVFGLESLKATAQQRSITELLGWMKAENAWAEFAMALKRVYVMYGVFAYAYYPIAIYMLAAVIAAAMAVWQTIRRKDLWIGILTLGSFLASYLLVVVEGKVTLYRSAQFLPLFCAWGLLLAVYGVQELCRWAEHKGFFGRKQGAAKRWMPRILCAALTVIVWNQCMDLNKWFYVDYLKYEDAKNTVDKIAYELEKGFDTSKPIIFTGMYRMPDSILADTYVPYGSETFFKINRLTQMVDEHLLEKFYRDEGVWVAQMPSLSLIGWGISAFDTNEELIRFFAMHGHDLVPYTDTTWADSQEQSQYRQAEVLSKDWPSFPKEGSIQDMGDYIIVHL